MIFVIGLVLFTIGFGFWHALYTSGYRPIARAPMTRDDVKAFAAIVVTLTGLIMMIISVLTVLWKVLP